MIDYRVLARIRREVENILLLVDELEAKGIPKAIIVDIIINESEKVDSQNDGTSEE